MFIKWANHDSFSFHFWSFQTDNAVFTTNQCENYPSSIRRQDSNPQPNESTPITTSPWFPHPRLVFFICRKRNTNNESATSGWTHSIGGEY